MRNRVLFIACFWTLFATAAWIAAAILFWLLIATPTSAQQSNWWGGQPTATGYPNQSTPITASATGTTAAISVTLPGVVGKTTFICGFAMTSGGTTAALTVDGTVAGVISGTMNFAYVFVATGQGAFGVAFSPACIPASAMNTAIVVSLPAGGAGTTAAVTAWGYQL